VLGFGSLLLGGPPLDLREHDWFRFSALGHFFWFSLGLALAVVSIVDWKSELPRAARACRAAIARPGLFWAGGLAIYVFTVLTFYPSPFIIAPFRDSWEYNTLNLIQGVGALLLFIPAVFSNPNRGVPARIVGHPVLMWVGLISYGLLLWNVTIAVLLGYRANESYWTVLILGSLATLPLAALSYYAIERPLMKLKYQPMREVLNPHRRDAAPESGGSR
jgi:peptidoglycan/LPS O-acetylase OafA/YrhL